MHLHEIDQWAHSTLDPQDERIKLPKTSKYQTQREEHRDDQFSSLKGHMIRFEKTLKLSAELGKKMTPILTITLIKIRGT
jgi:hypothetical protein